MNGYLLSVIGTVLIAAVITAILPDGKTSAVIKNVTKLACVLAILAPVLGFFATGELDGQDQNSQTFFSQSVIQTDDRFIKYYCSMRIQATEATLEKELSDQYSASTVVTLTWNLLEEKVDNRYLSEKIQIVCINVVFEEEPSAEVKKAVWEYLTKNYCSEVLIE